MRSAALRATIGVIAWIVLGVAAFLLIRSERQISQLASSLRAFDQQARNASDALAEARVAQHGYVAAGQGNAFWMDKVTASTESADTALAALRQSATAGGRTAVEAAAATAAEFGSIDRRVREYLASGQQLMAADIIFTEGSDAAATAGRQVETARLAEHQVFDVAVGDVRRQQVITIGAAAAMTALIILILIPVRRAASADGTDAAGSSETAEPVSTESIAPAPAPPLIDSMSPTTTAGMFRAASELATDFGRVRNVDDLTRLLARAAEILDASGLIVWMGSTNGADLRPVLAHGYKSQMIARMPPVPRNAENAAASAYRAGTLQIVLARPGRSSGAVIAPILSADGCVGALSAEIRSGGEASEVTQALTTIFAAHLAGVLAITPAADVSDAKAVAQA